MHRARSMRPSKEAPKSGANPKSYAPHAPLVIERSFKCCDEMLPPR